MSFFYKEVKTPKVSQTLFLLKDGKIEKLFITKVIITKKIESSINFKSEIHGVIKSGLISITQSIEKSFKNHILIHTRCGKIINLNLDLIISNDENISNKLFFEEIKAKKELSKNSNIFVLVDEFGSYKLKGE